MSNSNSSSNNQQSHHLQQQPQMKKVEKILMIMLQECPHPSHLKLILRHGKGISQKLAFAKNALCDAVLKTEVLTLDLCFSWCIPKEMADRPDLLGCS